MPTRNSILLSTLILLLACGLAAGAENARNLGPTKAPEVIKVGITEYQNIEATYQKYEVLFTELASYASPQEPLTFEFAIGTYGEVLDWYNNRSIDIAILSAMPAAELLQVGEIYNLNRAYLGDVSVTIRKSSKELTLMDLFKPTEDPFTYRPGCIVLNSDKELNTLQDIKRLWDADQVKFLFVRPYSMSGYIAPLDFLRRNGIDPTSRPDRLEFTYQHSKSLEMMIKSLSAQSVAQSRHLVAFVLDDTRYETTKIPNYQPTEPTFRRIDLPELDKYNIPREVILANYNQEQDKLENGSNKFQKYRDLMLPLLRRWNEGKQARIQRAHAAATTTNIEWRYEPSSAWINNYTAIQDALRDTNLPKQLLYKSNIDDLLDDLARAESPRLALVLSGGGAKCAYQAGAIIEIEKKLKEKTKKLQEKKENKTLDIDLVVGTSGGAINALLVALGITKEEAAQEQLATTWRSFRQQNFLQPSARFSLFFGICFGLLQTLLIVVAVLLFDRETMNWRITSVVLLTVAFAQMFVGYYFGIPDEELLVLFGIEIVAILALMGLVAAVDYFIHRTGLLDQLHHWRQVTVVMMLIFGLLEFLVAMVPSIGDFVEQLSESHWVEHLWTAVTLISVWTFPYPLLLAIVVAAIGTFVAPGFDWNKWREYAVLWTAIVLVFASGVLVLHLLFKESSPSGSIGIENEFVKQIPSLVQNTIDRSFKTQAIAGRTELEALSEQILSGSLLKRDLVITTSKLPVSEDKKALPVNALPDDLYFYHHGNKNDQLDPPPDKRFVPLKYNKEKLLDVVIGSSTIYPIFSPRALSSVWLGNEFLRSTEPIKEMRIIDGGFIHNIPIQAARRWGATHIIVIDASPTPQMRDPQHLWDNTVMAFGYLFKQAQAGDALERVGTFELRPSSSCEKLNIKPVCTDSDPPEPNMDTFDFSNRAAKIAFKKGQDDVNSLVPLFVRVPGAPIFRSISPRPAKT